MYASDTTGAMQDFGDGGGRYDFTRPPFQWFANRLKDPYAYNYIKDYWESGRGGYNAYLWYTEGLETKSREDLPTSRMFEGKGNMIMRSGWDQASTIVIFKSGPNSNHYHYDQGQFVIKTNGEDLLHDPGTGGGYYQPYYLIYNSMSVAHNVLLLDMDAESQWPADYDNGIAALRTWPRMIHHFAGEIADAAEGDLACVYKNKLSSYTRTLLYTKTGALFLFDKVKSYEPHEFNWLFHSDPSTMRMTGNRLTVDKENARLTLDVIASDTSAGGASGRAGRRGSSVRVAPHQATEGYVAISSRPDVSEAVFLAVLTPEAKPANGFGTRPVTTRIDSKGWLGAKTERGDVYDIAMFRLDNSPVNDVLGFETDASRFTASYEKGRLVKAYFEGSALIGNGLDVRASAPATIAVASKGNGFDVEVKAAKEVEITVTAAKPSSVTVNGTASKNWKYDSKTSTVKVSVPEERTNLSIR
jgi:hypothetical protein